MDENDYWLPQEMADSIRGAVEDERETGETIGKLQERGDFAWSEECVYTFTITTFGGQVFEVIVRELPHA